MVFMGTKENLRSYAYILHIQESERDILMSWLFAHCLCSCSVDLDWEKTRSHWSQMLMSN